LKKFTRADTLFGQLTPLLTCYDVGYYHLDIDIDAKNELVRGYSEITFKIVEASSKIRLDLFEYFKIKSIQYKGNDLKFNRDTDAVYIDFDQLLEKGTTHSIKVSYEGRPLDVNFDLFAGAFLWQTDDNDNPWIQSFCQGYGPKGWWPSKNHVSDEPDSASVSISVPENLYAVSNGKLIRTETLGNDKVKYHWAVSNPINNYNMAVHVGKYETNHEVFESIGGKKLNLNYYFLKSDKDLATKKLSIVPQMLTVYEKYFGAYPFINDGFKIVQSPYPMEHQSCVAVGQYFDEQLILHESAHEWWGNSVSCADNSDIWIHEAFATYAESLYIEETLGYGIGQEYLNSKKDKILNDFPLIGVQGVNHFHYRIEDKYFKGALMLNTLRHLVANDKLWFSTLKGIQTDFRHSSIDTKTVIKYFNEKLGGDFNAFFYQYLQTTDIPILTIQKMEPQGFKYKWSNSIDSFKLSLKLTDDKILQPTTTWSTETSSTVNSQVVQEWEEKYLIKVKWQ
jgi:aminopeptidase N